MLATLARGISALIAWAAVLVVLAWVVARAVGDRVELLQHPSWVPAHFMLVGALFAVFSATMLIAGVRRKERRRPPIGLVLLWLCVLGLGGYVALVEHRVQGLLGEPGEGGIELLFWNQAGGNIEPEAVERLIGRSDPAIITDFRTRGGPGRIPRRSVRAGTFTIFTDREVIESRAQTLGFRATRFGAEPSPAAIDPGWFVRVALGPSPEDPEPIELWLIDLPSDIRLHRMEVLERAAEAAAGLPEPDFIIGDFNTPRGAPSLRRLVGGRVEASASGGPYLLRGTWPRRTPLWHLDMLYPSDGWRATDYRIVDPGTGTHMAIRARLERR
ncbi:MAG: endonuclease/exonuclease/phosphatase family protein [Phycisphaerales bacterium]|nr:MAG: endonuclease/exonuclease/phosphatase family protein [Phycisphaerales bacterium]